MKKRIIALSLILLFTISSLNLTGCIGCFSPISKILGRTNNSDEYVARSNTTNKTKDNSTANTTPKNNTTPQTQTPPVTTQPTTPITPNPYSNLVGTWEYDGVYFEGDRFGPEEIYFNNCYLKMNSDNTYILNIEQTPYQGMYEIRDNLITFTSTITPLSGTISDNHITVYNAYTVDGRNYDFVFEK